MLSSQTSVNALVFECKLLAISQTLYKATHKAMHVSVHGLKPSCQADTGGFSCKQQDKQLLCCAKQRLLVLFRLLSLCVGVSAPELFVG